MPRVSSLHYPTPCFATPVSWQALVTSTFRRNMPGVPLQHHDSMSWRIVIGRIQTQVLWLFTRGTRSDQSTVVDQGLQHWPIVNIRCRHDDTEGHTSAVNQDVVFNSWFRAICWIGAAFFSPLPGSARKCHHPLATPIQYHASHRRGANTRHGFVQRLRHASTLQNGHKRSATARTLRAMRATGNRPITNREWHQGAGDPRCGDVRHVRAMAAEEADTRSPPTAYQELVGVFSSQHFTKLL
jgi:hypothetical protein